MVFPLSPLRNGTKQSNFLSDNASITSPNKKRDKLRLKVGDAGFGLLGSGQSVGGNTRSKASERHRPKPGNFASIHEIDDNEFSQHSAVSADRWSSYLPPEVPSTPAKKSFAARTLKKMSLLQSVVNRPVETAMVGSSSQLSMPQSPMKATTTTRSPTKASMSLRSPSKAPMVPRSPTKASLSLRPLATASMSLRSPMKVSMSLRSPNKLSASQHSSKSNSSQRSSVQMNHASPHVYKPSVESPKRSRHKSKTRTLDESRSSEFDLDPSMSFFDDEERETEESNLGKSLSKLEHSLQLSPQQAPKSFGRRQGVCYSHDEVDNLSFYQTHEEQSIDDDVSYDESFLSGMQSEKKTKSKSKSKSKKGKSKKSKRNKKSSRNLAEYEEEESVMTVERPPNRMLALVHHGDWSDLIKAGDLRQPDEKANPLFDYDDYDDDSMDEDDSTTSHPDDGNNRSVFSLSDDSSKDDDSEDDSDDDDKESDHESVAPDPSVEVKEDDDERVVRRKISRMSSGQLRRWGGFEDQVTVLVRESMPSQLSKVKDLMQQFAGREAELVHTLTRMASKAATRGTHRTNRAAMHKSPMRTVRTVRQPIGGNQMDALASVAAASRLEDNLPPPDPEELISSSEESNGEYDDQSYENDEEDASYNSEEGSYFSGSENDSYYSEEERSEGSSESGSSYSSSEYSDDSESSEESSEWSD